MGFSTEGIKKTDTGYIVEGDIYIPQKDLLQNDEKGKNLKTQQYRTTNLVKYFPRIITISVSPTLPPNYKQAVFEAINNYNNIGFGLSFQMVESGGAISVIGYYEASKFFGTSGFPTADGNPYPQINLNTYQYGSAPNISFLASVIQHEIGHCIGLRHTDFMDRSYSCGGLYANEGAAPVGAIQIPNTPSGADVNSFMLACTSPGINRTFNSNDIFGLHALYPKVAGRVPVLAFYNGQTTDHYFTTNQGLNGVPNWEYESIRFFAHDSPVNGAVPIYVYYNAQGGDHYYTPVPNAFSGSVYWKYEGIAFYAFKTQVPGTLPVRVYYNATTADHYLATGILSALNWNFESIQFYAYPFPY